MTADNRDSRSSQSNNGILVLVDGKVLPGRFTPRPDGYDVQVAGGRSFIESERVRFVARDLHDAHEKLRSSFVDLTPEIHVQLARWCMTNDLPDLAKREVLDALHLDPNRQDAQRLLEVLLQDEQSGTYQGLSRLTEFPSTQRMAAANVETRSLAGLTAPVAQQFTTHVQRLLMNKCANAGCHGGQGGSSFQLTSAHRGTNTAISERNLAAVLKQIDISHPSSSPLLEVLDTNHANQSTPLFRGRSGAQQMEMLKVWVFAVCNDIAPEANQESVADNPVRLASAQTSELPAGSAQRTPGDIGMLAHGRAMSAGETDAGFLKAANRANANDAFDPSVFNRKYHGSAGANTTAQSPDDDAHRMATSPEANL
jgi:hypothetical protein